MRASSLLGAVALIVTAEAVCLSAESQAETPWYEPSLEWLTEASANIGVYGVVTAAVDSVVMSGAPRGFVTLSGVLASSLKGDAPDSIAMRLRSYHFQPIPSRGDQLLVFNYGVWEDPYIIALSNPGHKFAVAVTRSFSVAHTSEEVLGVIARQQSVRESEQAPLVRYEKGVLREAPDSSAVARLLHGLVYVGVPADEAELSRLLSELDESAPLSVLAARTMEECYPGALSPDRLWALYEDSTTVMAQVFGRTRDEVYHLTPAWWAFKMLQARGIDAPSPNPAIPDRQVFWPVAYSRTRKD